MILAAVFLALASVAVALVRRGRFGRRLIALRDSEAAYAMLGGNLLAAKVAVFAFSAGIAGLGGALYAMQLQSIIAGQFAFQVGLPIFLVAVVGGLSWVGTGLFTGTLLIGPLGALSEIAPGLSNLAALLPGLAGIGLGRNPAGLIPAMRAQSAALGRRKALLAGLLVVIAALWALRLTGAINGWAFCWGTIVISLAAQLYARSRQESGPAPQPVAEPGQQAATKPVKVEWWGLERPWRAEDEEVLDRVIARG
jgi:branched-chain amino acid transport system permease protein